MTEYYFPANPCDGDISVVSISSSSVTVSISNFSQATAGSYMHNGCYICISTTLPSVGESMYGVTSGVRVSGGVESVDDFINAVNTTHTFSGLSLDSSTTYYVWFGYRASSYESVRYSTNAISFRTTISGSGTQADPYIIWSPDNLALLSGSGYASYSGANVYFELGADIDFDGGSFTPIGNSTYPFNGHFDGKNYTISNMIITSNSGSSGLFSVCTGACQISNISMIDCSVTETGSNNCGMLIGRVNSGNGASISYIETDGCSVVSSGNNVGGISGGSLGNAGVVTYSNCYVHEGKVVSSGNTVGGIVGNGSTGAGSYAITYSNCTVEQEVVLSTGSYAVGGIVGNGAYNESIVTYSGCIVKSSVVIASTNATGGIVGYCSATTATSEYTDCEVTNTYISSSNGGIVGGIAGYAFTGCLVDIDGCTVTECTICGNSYVGGVVGRALGTVTITSPVVTHNDIQGNSSVGGAIGGNS